MSDLLAGPADAAAGLAVYGANAVDRGILVDVARAEGAAAALADMELAALGETSARSSPPGPSRSA